MRKISGVVVDYEKRLQGMAFVQRLSFGHSVLMEGGGPKRKFVTCLFCHKPIAMQLLMAVVVLRSNVQCNTCGRHVLQNPVLLKD